MWTEAEMLLPDDAVMSADQEHEQQCLSWEIGRAAGRLEERARRTRGFKDGPKAWAQKRQEERKPWLDVAQRLMKVWAKTDGGSFRAFCRHVAERLRAEGHADPEPTADAVRDFLRRSRRRGLL